MGDRALRALYSSYRRALHDLDRSSNAILLTTIFRSCGTVDELMRGRGIDACAKSEVENGGGWPNKIMRNSSIVVEWSEEIHPQCSINHELSRIHIVPQGTLLEKAVRVCVRACMCAYVWCVCVCVCLCCNFTNYLTAWFMVADAQECVLCSFECTCQLSVVSSWNADRATSGSFLLKVK